MSKPIALSHIPSPRHTFPGHPENPGRFSHFPELLEGLLSDHVNQLDATEDRDGTIDAILRCHDEDYIQRIQGAMAQAPVFLDYGDTYATPQSFESAIQAVAGTLSVANAIHHGISTSGFALIRPPGHHASQARAEGFCLFNNIAVAAKSLQNDGYAKIAIVDFDVHHGNGTQAIFDRDPDVLYISTHQWGIYPGTGAKSEVGHPPGEGATINLPLPAYSGDHAFRQCVEHIIQPALQRFTPDFMLISAGFDAHWSDPLANLQLTTRGYHALAMDLIQISDQYCEGRLACVLEGGYDPEALADNVGAVLYALAGLDLPADRMGPAPIDEPNIHPLIEEIRSIHSL